MGQISDVNSNIRSVLFSCFEALKCIPNFIFLFVLKHLKAKVFVVILFCFVFREYSCRIQWKLPSAFSSSFRMQ